MRGFAMGDDLHPLEKKIFKIGPQVSVWRTTAASARFMQPRPRDVGYIRYFWHGRSTYINARLQKEILKIGQLDCLWWPAAALPRSLAGGGRGPRATIYF